MREIKKRKDERKYSRIRAEADDIIQERKRISCLSVREAEQGRIEGGRRNVEASCLIGRQDKTNAQDTGAIKKSQELKLEEWARHVEIKLIETLTIKPTLIRRTKRGELFLLYNVCAYINNSLLILFLIRH